VRTRDLVSGKLSESVGDMVRIGAVVLVGWICLMSVGCKNPSTQIVVQVPADFSGQVHIEMGVPGAPGLPREGRNYRVSIPPDGKVATSTIVGDAAAIFENVPTRNVWGYSRMMIRTQDRLPVGGNIDFFIGTKEQFESAEAKKHKSGLPERGSLHTT
jgi:hypothetical protein